MHHAIAAREVRTRWRADFEKVRAEFEIAPHLQERWEAWLGNDALWPEFTAFTHGELYAAHVLIGQIAESIVAHAKAKRCDLIYIGTRGHTGVKSAVLGSTAQKVLHISDTPVLLVK